MGVVAVHGKGQLIGHRFSGQAGAGVQQLLHGGCRAVFGARQGQNEGVATACGEARHIEQVFDTKTQPGQGPRAGMGHRH